MVLLDVIVYMVYCNCICLFALFVCVSCVDSCFVLGTAHIANARLILTTDDCVTCWVFITGGAVGGGCSGLG